ncbi:hypothetical protein [Microvirga massiliensis]|nr:hypothetical protein [Microvirga massiliensis]
MAASIIVKGVPVDSQFYRKDRRPPLGYEYQINLDTGAEMLALE